VQDGRQVSGSEAIRVHKRVHRLSRIALYTAGTGVLRAAILHAEGAASRPSLARCRRQEKPGTPDRLPGYIVKCGTMPLAPALAGSTCWLPVVLRPPPTAARSPSPTVGFHPHLGPTGTARSRSLPFMPAPLGVTGIVMPKRPGVLHAKVRRQFQLVDLRR